MVMKETENLRKTYVLERGSYDAPSREVKPMTPSALGVIGLTSLLGAS